MERPLNALFLCTGNSARSILAESILAKEGEGRFRAYSAGSQPKGAVNPLAIETLEILGYPTAGLRSKSWDAFDAAGAPAMDVVITVCDNAAGDVCPIWPGHPIKAHWGIDDPASVEGSHADRLAAFAMAFRYLHDRISAFIALPMTDESRFEESVRTIGRRDGATRKT